jgi:lipopolysaccharide export system protein LptA
MTAARPTLPRRTALAAALLALPLTALSILALPSAAAAQGLMSKGGNQPLTINADDGIEWQREEKKYTARGNAKATRDGATLYADLLTAYYREKTRDQGQEQGQDIFRVDADGHVRIAANGQEAHGDKAVYYVDKAVFVLVGKHLTLTSNQGILTARDSLEYWENRRLAVARGDATVVQQNQRLRADVLTAHVADPNDPKRKAEKAKTDRAKTADTKAGKKPGGPEGANLPQGAGEIEKIDAFGNVHISLQNAIIRGDNGVYLPAKGVATICGNVRVTSGKNQLNGKCAEVNLKTGIYRLTGRATGLVQPRQKDR